MHIEMSNNTSHLWYLDTAFHLTYGTRTDTGWYGFGYGIRQDMVGTQCGYGFFIFYGKKKKQYQTNSSKIGETTIFIWNLLIDSCDFVLTLSPFCTAKRKKRRRRPCCCSIAITVVRCAQLLLLPGTPCSSTSSLCFFFLPFFLLSFFLILSIDVVCRVLLLIMKGANVPFKRTFLFFFLTLSPPFFFKYRITENHSTLDNWHLTTLKRVFPFLYFASFFLF